MSRVLRSTTASLGRSAASGRSAGFGRLVILSIALSTLLGGCAVIGPFAERLDPAPTGSIQTGSERPAASQLASSDWEAIRSKAAAIIPAASAGSSVDWSNPSTGSSGSVSPIATAEPKGNTRCRAFAATLNDIRGARRYRSQACLQNNGKWVIGPPTAEDAFLS